MAGRRSLRRALLALLLAAPSLAHAGDSVPQWVRDAAAETLPAYPANTDAVRLLDETTLTVMGPGNTVEHHREVVRILRPQGRHYGELGTYYDPDSKIVSLKIWTISAAGKEYQLRDNELADFGMGEGNLFVDTKWRGGRALARDPGAVVAIEYEQQNRPYMTEDVWTYQSAVPVHRAVYTLQLPRSFEFSAVWVRHHPEMQPQSLGNNRWQWTLNDVPGVNVEHVVMHPGTEAMAERMSVHYFGPGIETPFRGDWKSVGLWYSRLSEGRLTPTPEIAAKAQELTAGKTDFYAKASAVADYMQRNIRYFDIEIGIGGFQPHYAGDIFKNLYGDCKDKATLTLALLGTVGINGRPMIVHDERGVIDPKAPSAYSDHEITAIEVPAGADISHLDGLVTVSGGKRYVIFDPTNPWVPFGQVPYYEQGGYGLLTDGADSQIVAIPVETPEHSTLTRSAAFKLSAEGTLIGEVTEQSFGNSAMFERERLMNADNKKRDEWLDRRVRQDLSNFSVAGLAVGNLQEVDHPLQVRYALTAPQYSKAMGALLLVRPRVLGSDVPPVDPEPMRTMPVDLEQTRTEHEDFSIELPAGYVVDEMPLPVKVDVGFASYESATIVQGDTLHYTRTFTVRQVELPAAQYSELFKLAGIIKADEQARVVLKRTE